ncbi:MAG: hypothetical protein KAX11_05820, partial [Candidatus Aminicenantes bacterium]|nr:hypothetical protein [Candidatus Aminicenantes bacterium]
MVLKLILKEWKERFGLILFAVAIIGLFALSYVVFREKTELVSILTGTMMLLFLTFMSWVIGASAWESEHKDGAWAYLFSKPLSKWKIWGIKFISMLSLVALIIGLFYILPIVLPGFKSVISEF